MYRSEDATREPPFTSQSLREQTNSENLALTEAMRVPSIKGFFLTNDDLAVRSTQMFV